MTEGMLMPFHAHTRAPQAWVMGGEAVDGLQRLVEIGMSVKGDESGSCAPEARRVITAFKTLQQFAPGNGV